MKSFKTYYKLKEGWRDYMPTFAKGKDELERRNKELAKKRFDKARELEDKAIAASKKVGTGAYDDIGWDALKKAGQIAGTVAAATPGVAKKAGRIAQKVNPYAKGNVIGKAADWMDRTTKRMQGDISQDAAAFDAFRRKIAKIYRNHPQNPELGGNEIDRGVRAILNLPKYLPVKGEPTLVPGGRDPESGKKLPPTEVYDKAYTAYIQAKNSRKLFDLINFQNPKGTGLYTDAHHFANIVLDVMASFLAGGKYSYKDAAAIIYGQPGSTSGMFNPEAIAVLDKYGMLYRQ
tara:strand:- start:1392 stop:2261 length:870 start_codon:yes stop_codon:yes gene_type:complete